MSKSIYLSPSTQENNIGQGTYGTEEARMNEVCDVVQAILESYGVTTYRNAPDMTLSEVVKDSDSLKPDYHFAIHSNAYNENARGSEVHVYSLSSDGLKLANAVYDRLEPLTPTTDRGIKVSPGFYELHYTDAPAALVEIDFHDNVESAIWIQSNIEEIGQTLAHGVLDLFEIEIKSTESSEDSTEDSTDFETKVIERLDIIIDLLK